MKDHELFMEGFKERMLNTKLNILSKNYTLSSKKLFDFIRAHPNGVTFKDLKKAGLSVGGMNRLRELDLVSFSRAYDSENESSRWHWVIKACRGGGE